MPSPDISGQVPPWPKFARPLLEVLSDGQIWKTRDLKAAVIDRLQLSEAQRAVTLNSGQTQAYNRAGWALDFLTRATAVQKVRNGESQITDLGRQLLCDHPVEITEVTLRKIPAYQAYVPKKRANTTAVVDVERLPSYWFVGAFFDGTEDDGGAIGDQTSRFVKKGCWVNGNRDRYVDAVKAMQPGERIAIKGRLHPHA